MGARLVSLFGTSEWEPVPYRLGSFVSRRTALMPLALVDIFRQRSEQSDRAPADEPITSIVYKEDQAVLTIREPRMFEQVGFLARAFTLLSEHGVVVNMVATSEVSVSVTSHDHASLRAAVADLQRLGTVDLQTGKSILAVVGRNIHGAKGIGARVMKAIAGADVNVQMHSFGMSSNNMSLLIDDADVERAVPALHRALFED